MKCIFLKCERWEWSWDDRWTIVEYRFAKLQPRDWCDYVPFIFFFRCNKHVTNNRNRSAFSCSYLSWQRLRSKRGIRARARFDERGSQPTCKSLHDIQLTIFHRAILLKPITKFTFCHTEREISNVNLAFFGHFSNRVLSKILLQRAAFCVTQEHEFSRRCDLDKTGFKPP